MNTAFCQNNLSVKQSAAMQYLRHNCVKTGFGVASLWFLAILCVLLQTSRKAFEVRAQLTFIR